MMEIPHCDGLPFLVAQGVEAANHFQGESFGTKEIEQILRDMRREKENIILIGMPGVGKTTVGKALGEEMSRTCKICSISFVPKLSPWKWLAASTP